MMEKKLHFILWCCEGSIPVLIRFRIQRVLLGSDVIVAHRVGIKANWKGRKIVLGLSYPNLRIFGSNILITCRQTPLCSDLEIYFDVLTPMEN